MNDQMTLAAALVDGAFETPLWATFLEGLRKATGADYAALIFRPPGRRFDQALHLLSGEGPSPAFLDLYRKYYYPQEPPPRLNLIEGRPYTFQELLDPQGADAAFYDHLVAERGLAGLRHMRVQEATGVNAWLTISRQSEDFADGDAALLATLAPVLRGVLRQYIAAERERFAASLTADAVRRLQFGWIALDAACHVVDCDDQCSLLLANSGVLGRAATGRLTANSPHLEREITLAVSRMVKTPHGRARALSLSRDPWLDMLLVPARRDSFSASRQPAVIAYVHGDSWRSADRCEQLAELFALSPSEARMALALSRGMTISEAATEFGLTIKTARFYSKTIYSKTGARGLPDLVRIVMRSVLAIAPDG